MGSLSCPEQPPIPGYEPIRPLSINLGAVYLARHSTTSTLVALKVWRLEFAEHARDLHAPSTRLHHPNILRVIEMGEFEGNFFCALEYFELSLADRLQDGPLPGLEAARIVRAVGSALQYARDQGMAARSLSPNSILLTDESVPKLLEFCATETLGRPPNTPSLALMPPEWVSGVVNAGEASQVYRIGALMYELLTARLPFTADSAVPAVMRVLHETPEPPRKVNPRVGPDLDAVCVKCLAKAPRERYASLQDLLDQLEPFASS
jgi:eukaryotic-like serine/threonine-protein kinase